MEEENIVREEAGTENAQQTEKRAKKHIHFKIHICIYLLVVAFFWLLWFFLFKGKAMGEDSIFLKLTLAITLFWGLFIIFHYLFAYKWNKSYLEKEVLRLQKKEKTLKKQLAELQTRTAELESSLTAGEKADE